MMRGIRASSLLRVSVILAFLGLIAGLVACSGGGDSSVADSSGDRGGSSKVVLVTYDSFALPKEAAAEFKRRTGATIEVTASGDSATMLAKALLTAGSPEGDVIFGVDNTLATRAMSADLLADINPPNASKVAAKYVIGGDATTKLAPIDHGDVCMNVDAEWFRSRRIAMPTVLDDLAAPAYRNLTVVESPVTSSPGLAFLIGTVARYGEHGWQTYWKKLKENGLRVRPSWDDAYYADYTASGGDRPVVLSYASSPPAEVVFSEGKRSSPASQVMIDSCVSQVEYAGVLKGAENPELAAKLVDFMLSDEWQSGLPLSNFVYPVVGVELPAEFKKWAPPVADPLELDPTTIDAHREEWIETWRQIME